MFRGVLLVLKRYIPQTAFHSLKNQVHLKDFTVLTYVTAHRRRGGDKMFVFRTGILGKL